MAWLLLGLFGCGPASYEGDAPGECADDADNDQDGLFDCADEGCAGAAACQDDDDAGDDDDGTGDDDDGTGDDDDGTGDDDDGTGDDDDGTGDDDDGTGDDDDVGDDDAGDDDDVGDDDDSGCSCTVDVTIVPVAGSQYVGVTSTARSVDQGLPLLQSDCQAAHSGSHLCFDFELLRSFPAPVPGVDALVISTAVADDGQNRYFTGGLRFSSQFGSNCASSGLFTGNSSGLRAEVLTAAGNLTLIPCNTQDTFVAACCSP